MSSRVLKGLAVVLMVISLSPATAEEVYRLRLFFGLSLPGGGGVSLQQWHAFERDQLAKAFDGFNVVDSVGYYQGKPERSKVVTLIATDADIPKAKALASLYATTFHQESVMMVKIPVAEWSFIGPEPEEEKSP